MLTIAGFSIADGLSETELLRAESVLVAPFPPDLREFLAQGLPRGDRFPNWREPESDAPRDQLDWPAEGICFDIEHNDFWWDEWGPRPPKLADALALGREQVAKAPTLIPVYGHRYLPAEPCTAGNPVLSVYQTDIIYYGGDLKEYLRNDFDRSHTDGPGDCEARHIRFWSDVVQWNGG